MSGDLNAIWEMMNCLATATFVYDLWNHLSGMNGMDKTTLLCLEMTTAIFMNLMIVLFAGRLGG
jgi:hypothetical protein